VFSAVEAAAAVASIAYRLGLLNSSLVNLLYLKTRPRAA
jgi:hypothetical protein